jgi:hypothetical protein
MRTRLFVTLLAVLGITALTAQAARIAFNDKAGTSRTYKMELKVTGAVDAMGISAPVDASVTQTMVEKITDVANGVATVNTSSSGGAVEVKVSLPDENGTTKPQTMKQELPGMTVDFKRTANGKVSDVKMSGDAMKMFGGDNGMMGMGQFPGQGIQFPDGDVKVGDTWTGKETVTLAGDSSIDITVKYALSGTQVVDGKTYLVITADINANVPKLNAKTVAGEGAPDMQMAMTMKGQAKTLFDEAAGEIYKEFFNLTTNITMTGNGENAMSMKMNMNMKGSMTKTK